jgi:hypothetical protein
MARSSRQLLPDVSQGGRRRCGRRAEKEEFERQGVHTDKFKCELERIVSAQNTLGADMPFRGRTGLPDRPTIDGL